MGKRVEKKLGARTVAALKQPGRHSDGGGLYLSISKHGRRRWMFLYTRAGKRSELGLGGAPSDIRRPCRAIFRLRMLQCVLSWCKTWPAPSCGFSNG